ncbi:hypothetical protein PENTCL1PPCAC_8435, partial [Pristionchus entomophagus]
ILQIQMDYPIKVLQLVQLKHLGIYFGSNYNSKVTMESDKFIVSVSPTSLNQKISEFGNVTQQVTINDIEDQCKIGFPIHCESLIMHPRRKIIATKNGKKLQILDISNATEIAKSHNHNDSVVFWKWIDDETIGIVTKSSAYHWSITGERTKMMNHTLSGFKIVDYRMSDDGQWLLLNGFRKESKTFHSLTGLPTSRQSSRAHSKLFLCDMTRRVSRLIECPGTAVACFAKFRMKGNCHPSNLLLYHYQGGKINMIEIGPPGYGNTPYSTKSETVHESNNIADDEFPISIHTSKEHGMAYLVTKFGFVHYFDVESGARLHSQRFSKEGMFVATKHAQCGLIGIDLRGIVLKVTLNEQNMIETVAQTNPNLAFELVRRWNSTPALPPKPAQTVVSHFPVPSAPCLSLEEFEPEERREAHMPPRPKIPAKALPVIPPFVPLYVVPPSDETSNLTFITPKSDPAAFPPPPPYSAVENNDNKDLDADSLSRAERAERERDELAARCAELERKYREAITMKEMGNQQK